MMNPTPDCGGPGGFDERVRELLAAVEAHVNDSEWNSASLRRVREAAARVAEADPPRNTGDLPVNGGATQPGARGGFAAAAHVALSVAFLALKNARRYLLDPASHRDAYRLVLDELEAAIDMTRPLVVDADVLAYLSHRRRVNGEVPASVAQADGCGAGDDEFPQPPRAAVTIAADQDELAREAGRA